MAKKSTKSKPKKKRFAVERKPSAREMGFFARLKDVLPEQKKETVRVKTFIVEKPVYVSAREGRVLPPPQKYGFLEDGKKIDSRKSRYSKKNAKKEVLAQADEEFADEGYTEQDELAGEEGAMGEEQLAEGEEQLSEGEFPVDAGDEGIDDGEGVPVQRNHHRSGAMLGGVWWKRALFWGILAWLIILAGEVALHAINLVDLNLNRQWWVLLGIIVFVSLIYHAFFADKHLI